MHFPCVEGVEVHSIYTPAKGQHEFFSPFELTVGNGDTIADARAPQPFPLLQDLEYCCSVQRG